MAEMDVENLFLLPFSDLQRQVVREFDSDRTSKFTGMSNDDLKKAIVSLRSRIDAVVSQNSKFLREKVCEEYDYCAKRADQRVDLAAMLVDAGIILTFGVAVSPSLMAVYLIRLGVFDQFCDCGNKLTRSV